MKNMLTLTMIAVFLAVPGWALAETYQIDAVHSTAMFRVKHVDAGYFYGVFKDISGSLVFDAKAPEKSSVTAVVKTASVDSRNEARDKHLKSPDFFDAEKYPQMQFKSSAWKKVGDDIYEITGDFTLLGVSKTITVQAHYTGSGKGMQGETRAGFETVFSIKRSEYGMTKFLPAVIGDEVILTISLECVEQAPGGAAK